MSVRTWGRWFDRPKKSPRGREPALIDEARLQPRASTTTEASTCAVDPGRDPPTASRFTCRVWCACGLYAEVVIGVLPGRATAGAPASKFSASPSMNAGNAVTRCRGCSTNACAVSHVAGQTDGVLDHVVGGHVADLRGRDSGTVGMRTRSPHLGRRWSIAGQPWSRPQTPGAWRDDPTRSQGETHSSAAVRALMPMRVLPGRRRSAPLASRSHLATSQLRFTRRLRRRLCAMPIAPAAMMATLRNTPMLVKTRPYSSSSLKTPQSR